MVTMKKKLKNAKDLICKSKFHPHIHTEWMLILQIKGWMLSLHFSAILIL